MTSRVQIFLVDAGMEKEIRNINVIESNSSLASEGICHAASKAGGMMVLQQSLLYWSFNISACYQIRLALSLFHETNLLLCHVLQ